MRNRTRLKKRTQILRREKHDPRILALKCLSKNMESCNGGTQQWKLGEWVKVSGALRMCERGIHVTYKPEKWKCDRIFICEVRGIVQREDDKTVCRQVRLLLELTPQAWEAYQKVEAPALEAYQKAKALAWEACQKVEAPALEAYQKVEALAWEACQKVEAPALEACQKAKAQAWEAYQKVEAPAWEAYQNTLSDSLKILLKREIQK